MNAPQEKAKKTLTLNDLLRQDSNEEIWVLNTTQGATRGNVLFPVPNATGTDLDNVVIFNSFVPQCLTNQVTRKQLLESAQFKRAVNRGLLKLVSVEHANVLLQEPGAREEADKVRKMDINSASSEAQFGLGPEAQEQAEKAREGVSMPVTQFAELMDQNSDMEALNTLRSLGDLTLKDYRYVLKIAKEVNYSEVGKYCAAKLKAIKEEANSNEDAE